MTEISPEIEVDFQHQNSRQYYEFVSLVDKAEEAFSCLTRTDIPYYIFIDELEAYYGDVDIFNRDLYMIRDLIFTVKRFNANFVSAKMQNIKIICSVRTEILTANSRFIVTKEINKCIGCFNGYRTSFSINELKRRIKKYYKNTIWETSFSQIVNDLYRLGFLGNFLPAAKTYHWQHKGDASLILSDEWRLCVYYALHGALSLGGRNDYGLNHGREAQIGDVAQACVYEVLSSFALVDFLLYGKSYKGSIHISEFGKQGYGYIANLADIVHAEDKFDVVLYCFDTKFSCWKLKFWKVVK